MYYLEYNHWFPARRFFSGHVPLRLHLSNIILLLWGYQKFWLHTKPRLCVGNNIRNLPAIITIRSVGRTKTYLKKSSNARIDIHTNIRNTS